MNTVSTGEGRGFNDNSVRRVVTIGQPVDSQPIISPTKAEALAETKMHGEYKLFDTAIPSVNNNSPIFCPEIHGIYSESYLFWIPYLKTLSLLDGRGSFITVI